MTTAAGSGAREGTYSAAQRTSPTLDAGSPILRQDRQALEKLPGFAGYWLFDAGNGVFSSLSLFETPEQGMDSTKVVATWIRDEKLDTMIPNEPKITSGQVVAHSDRVLVAA